ncbi:esterase-like activity of phytase family protein [Nonomuraea purpurea]|uniref:Esterase-like activity of phytase family protein n=1 Tax=Nonomuraea purpurea TaxID=1849276 RepID=A0ABV8G834_9ACTN
MKISVWVAGQRDKEVQRSLINALFNNPKLREANISLQPAPQASDTMGPDFEVIQLIVDSGFQLATLALAFLAWRQDREQAGQLVVELDGTMRAVSDDDLRDLPSALRALSGQPDPRKSRCVLIGVTDYPHLGDLPAVGQSCWGLASTLADPDIWGVPLGQCQLILNPRTPRELLDSVSDAAAAAEDTLIVYFAGHGLRASGGDDLHLCLSGATQQMVGKEAAGKLADTVSWRDLRRILHGSRAMRRVVILDCCYSGLALSESDPSASLLEAVKAEGIYTLTSATKDSLAISPRTERHTAFTGKLIHVLRAPEGHSEFLTLDEVYHRVRNALVPHLPEPQRAGPAHIGSLPFFRTTPNLTHTEEGTGRDPDVDTAPPQKGSAEKKSFRGSRRRLLLGGGGLLLSATIVAAVAVMWPDSGPIGSCSANATLLDYSDELDKLVFEGATVGGLSAIAMTGKTEAVALMDNEPGGLLHLSLGDEEDLDVKIRKMTPLLHSDGSPFADEEIDGEGLVLRPDSVLVSSEIGPAILVFDMSTGRQTASLPVPPLFRAQSKGGEAGRETIESLAATPKRDFLYAGMETPLSRDGAYQGGNLLRILRYSSAAGNAYKPDAQYAYKADIGLSLTEIVALDSGKLLTLERGHIKGVGNTIRIFQTALTKRWDISWNGSLRNEPEEVFAEKTLLVDLGNCPAADAPAPQRQYNALLDNVEGMALGPMLPDRHRVLYLVSDDNLSSAQTTRIYKLDIRLP